MSSSLESMGTTFIKLGQFLATRPDIIGEEMAKDLEKLQDKVPAFELYEAKRVIKKEIVLPSLSDAVKPNCDTDDFKVFIHCSSIMLNP